MDEEYYEEFGAWMDEEEGSWEITEEYGYSFLYDYEDRSGFSSDCDWWGVEN